MNLDRKALAIPSREVAVAQGWKYQINFGGIADEMLSFMRLKGEDEMRRALHSLVDSRIEVIIVTRLTDAEPS